MRSFITILAVLITLTGCREKPIASGKVNYVQATNRIDIHWPMDCHAEVYSDWVIITDSNGLRFIINRNDVRSLRLEPVAK